MWANPSNPMLLSAHHGYLRYGHADLQALSQTAYLNRSAKPPEPCLRHSEKSHVYFSYLGKGISPLALTWCVLCMIGVVCGPEASGKCCGWGVGLLQLGVKLGCRVMLMSLASPSKTSSIQCPLLSSLKKNVLQYNSAPVTKRDGTHKASRHHTVRPVDNIVVETNQFIFSYMTAPIKRRIVLKNMHHT